MIIKTGGIQTSTTIALDKCVSLCGNGFEQEPTIVNELGQFFVEAFKAGVFKNADFHKKVYSKLFMQISLRTRSSAKILSIIASDKEPEWK